MNTKEIECRIKEFIECWYECIFKGDVKIKIIDPDIFLVSLILNQKERPVLLTYLGTHDDFWNFITKEIKSMRLTSTKYYSGYKNE